MRRPLEAAGIEFIDDNDNDNGCGPGVRLRKRQREKKAQIIAPSALAGH
jgi:hypothetical protein